MVTLSILEEPTGGGKLELADGTIRATRYGLTVTGEILNDLPGLKSIRGTLRGLDGDVAWRFFNDGEPATLHLDDGRRVKVLAHQFGDQLAIVGTGDFF